MLSGKVKFISLLILTLFLSNTIYSQISDQEKNKETLEQGIAILKKYFYSSENWHISPLNL